MRSSGGNGCGVAERRAGAKDDNSFAVVVSLAVVVGLDLEGPAAAASATGGATSLLSPRWEVSPALSTMIVCPGVLAAWTSRRMAVEAVGSTDKRWRGLVRFLAGSSASSSRSLDGPAKVTSGADGRAKAERGRERRFDGGSTSAVNGIHEATREGMKERTRRTRVQTLQLRPLLTQMNHLPFALPFLSLDLFPVLHRLALALPRRSTISIDRKGTAKSTRSLLGSLRLRDGAKVAPRRAERLVDHPARPLSYDELVVVGR